MPDPTNRPTSLLGSILEGWAAKGWPLADLGRFQMNAAGDGGDGGQGGGSGGAGGDGGQGGAGGDGDDAQLGEAGQRALAAERARAKAAEKAAKAAQAELDAIKAANATDQEKAVNAAKAEGRKEVLDQANRRLLRAEVRAAAGTKLSDPEDAVRLLDLDDFTVDDDGDVDTKKISAAIDELLKAKPYLAANGGGNGGGSKKFPDLGQGNRQGGAKPSAAEIGKEEARKRFPQPAGAGK